MGANNCQIFEKFSVALQLIMENKFPALVMSHVLDGFFSLLVLQILSNVGRTLPVSTYFVKQSEFL